ncbi:MAG: metal ABC transporter substrate-binding protein [Clostridiales bacterium]|nr:metal ABC transporter substrate-binding protein [Clostridiales bacterium]
MIRFTRKDSHPVRFHIRQVTATLLAAICLLLSLSACSSGGSDLHSDDAIETETADPAVASSRLRVMASFYPMYDFAVKIGGDKAQVTCMVPSGTEPHDWEPSAGDIAALEDADLFIYNGAGLEHWVDRILGTLGNQDLVVAMASSGIPLRTEGSHDDEDGETDSLYDPHVWLNPQYAKLELERIRDAYVTADPDNKAYYDANYQLYAGQFDELDRLFSDTLAPLPRKDIVVSHEAFGYLCDAYGLNQIAIDGLSPDSEPSPAKMAEIIDFVRDNEISAIFFEESGSSKTAEAIAAETGVETLVLNTLEGISDEDQRAGRDYFSVMKDNLASLTEALGQR